MLTKSLRGFGHCWFRWLCWRSSVLVILCRWGALSNGRPIGEVILLEAWWKLIIHTVDGRNPAPVEVGSLSPCLQGCIHPRWCRISSINGISKQLVPWQDCWTKEDDWSKMIAVTCLHFFHSNNHPQTWTYNWWLISRGCSQTCLYEPMYWWQEHSDYLASLKLKVRPWK